MPHPKLYRALGAKYAGIAQSLLHKEYRSARVGGIRGQQREALAGGLVFEDTAVHQEPEHASADGGSTSATSAELSEGSGMKRGVAGLSGCPA